jgi:hypothetical protein
MGPDVGPGTLKLRAHRGSGFRSVALLVSDRLYIRIRVMYQGAMDQKLPV